MYLCLLALFFPLSYVLHCTRSVARAWVFGPLPFPHPIFVSGAIFTSRVSYFVIFDVLSAWTCYFRPRRNFSFSCELFFHWMQCSSFWHLCELGSRCMFLIFVVRLESPLSHALDIRGLTGVATWEFIDFPSRYVEFFINVFGLFRLRRYDTFSLNCLVANCLCLSACLLCG